MPQTKEQRNQKQRERYQQKKKQMQTANVFFVNHMTIQKERIKENIEMLTNGIDDAEERTEYLKNSLTALNAQDYINKNNSFKWKDEHQEKKEAETAREIKKVNTKIEQLEKDKNIT